MRTDTMAAFDAATPIEEPTDEAHPPEAKKRRMPSGGSPRFSSTGWDLALSAKRPAPEGSPRGIGDIPARFRMPLKPPARR